MLGSLRGLKQISLVGNICIIAFNCNSATMRFNLWRAFICPEFYSVAPAALGSSHCILFLSSQHWFLPVSYITWRKKPFTVPVCLRQTKGRIPLCPLQLQLAWCLSSLVRKHRRCVQASLLILCSVWFWDVTILPACLQWRGKSSCILFFPFPRVLWETVECSP